MCRTTLIGLSAGFATLTALVAWQGLDTLAQTLAVAGFAVLWLPVYFAAALALATASWCWLFPRGTSPRAGDAVYVTWVGLAVNWLLPVAQLGGEVVRVRLAARRGTDLVEATASVIGDKTLQVASQVVFTLVGAGVLWRADSGLVLVAVSGAALFALATLGFYRAQRAGLFETLRRLLARVLGAASQAQVTEAAVGADHAVHAMYGRRGRLIASAFARAAFRLVLVGETWLALHLLGRPVSLLDAFVLESLGQAVRAAAFLVPAGIGAQEGGFLLLGLALGLPAEVGLSLSLVKRVRELGVGLPGLVAWQIEEGSRAWRAAL
jgi:putative membrane protein